MADPFQRRPVSAQARDYVRRARGIERAGASPPFASPHENYRVLTVGPPDSPFRKGHSLLSPPAQGTQIAALGQSGFHVDFSSISEAMDVIPLQDINSPDSFTQRWLILVTPGYYEEEIRLKPFVNVVGIDRDSVYVQAPSDALRYDPADPRGIRANVYLNYFTQISNITFGKRADSKPTDYVVWNKDTWGVGALQDADYPTGQPLGVSFSGVNNISTLLFGGTTGLRAKSKTALLEGNWRTIFFQTFGSSYGGEIGFDVEIQNTRDVADSHLIDCFFDALFLDVSGGGAVRLRGCIDVHLRNCFVRVGGSPAGQTVYSSALRVEGGARVLVEGSTLLAQGAPSTQLLDVEDGSRCDFLHSSTDSVSATGEVVERGLPSRSAARFAPAPASRPKVP